MDQSQVDVGEVGRMRLTMWNKHAIGYIQEPINGAKIGILNESL